MVQGKITEADTQTIRLGATPSGLTSAHLHHSPCCTTELCRILQFSSLWSVVYGHVECILLAATPASSTAQFPWHWWWCCDQRLKCFLIVGLKLPTDRLGSTPCLPEAFLGLMQIRQVLFLGEGQSAVKQSGNLLTRGNCLQICSFSSRTPPLVARDFSSTLIVWAFNHRQQAETPLKLMCYLSAIVWFV